MSEFSVSYAGLEDAISQLASISRKIAGISSDVYQTSNKVGGIKSLEDKDYMAKIRNCAKNADKTADQVYAQAHNLSVIGQLYSNAEKKALGALNERVTPQNGFSAQACVVSAAATMQQAFVSGPTLDESLKDVLGDQAHDALHGLDEFRYWRNGVVKKAIDDTKEQRKGKADDRLIDEIIDKANKAWGDPKEKIDQLDKISHAALNADNPDALHDGVEATMDMFGVGDTMRLVDRQIERQDAINAQFERELQEDGVNGRTICRHLAREGVYFVQLVGDTFYTGTKMVVKPFDKKVTGGKVSSTVFDFLDNTFSEWGAEIRKLPENI